ncbi:hypothetical protein SAMD00019534_116080 [Acytostelium subglobosum LB1]|uniref:hypothetical protein n=1 Tax=Acytostelium subglobosum LB1 TaxID=1410327 RepID=UPI0006451373|nr:hypothetical protein SAMD00019534_116080 [Acytostelium subglobosum LB1]GAM28432.1 hypothetical protein SAMD00019534_116080 [Acytostelium subglobosum LB1]|eukprot:XP_012748749.1 hypothetical protein SAMD00019534_116080 [Acytostelium subglobosum LB1]
MNLRTKVRTGFVSPVKVATKDTDTKVALSPPKQSDSRIPQATLWKHIPSINFDNDNDKDKEKEKDSLSNRIINYIYSKNEPLSLNEVINHLGTGKVTGTGSNVDKKLVESTLQTLLNKKLIAKIAVDKTGGHGISLYSSIQWHRLTQSYIASRQHDKANNAKDTQSTSSTSSTPIKSTTANDNKTNINHNNHLSTPTKKVNHLATPTKSKALQDSLKRKTTMRNGPSEPESPYKKPRTESDVYPLESMVNDELSIIAEERKRLKQSIEDKKFQLASFTSTTKPTPIQVSKKFQHGSNQNGNVDVLITKWKKVAKVLVERLQSTYMEALKKQEESDGLLCNLDPKVAAQRKRKNALALAGFQPSNSWIDHDRDQDKDQAGKDSDQYDDGGVGGGEVETREGQEDEDIDVTTKLFILKVFGLDPKVMDYDAENDAFR